MEITVNTDGIDLNTVIERGRDGTPITLADIVAEQLVERAVRDTNDDYYRGLAARVRELREDEIRKAVRPAIDKALAEPLRQTNGYGEPKGPELTLIELIVEVARDVMAEPVKDSYGRRSGDRTLLQETIRTEAEKLLRDELKAELDQEKAKVVAAVQGKAADMIAQAVKEGISRR